MQTASTNIHERLCNMSTCEISLLLNILQSTVSDILTKWKQLGTAETQPQSSRPHKMTEQGQLLLRCAEVANCRVNKDLQTLCGLQTSTTVCRELRGMGFHDRTAASNQHDRLPSVQKASDAVV
ncbi:unnamed protein product [Staurois parvus]|uniref:Transposase Tc1-like domain-containing protein n=1 Tax=Staurois parvus TaxID=386267 RepID=A0ABN9BNR2_9NEOB|nr:unnamed protein product [Staurois parvus]